MKTEMTGRLARKVVLLAKRQILKDGRWPDGRKLTKQDRSNLLRQAKRLEG